MRKFGVLLGVIAFVFLSRPASAATIAFDVCDIASLCGQLTMDYSLTGSGTIDVSVTGTSGYGIFGETGANHAFGFNLSPSGVNVTNISSGFTLGTSGGQINGYGTYEYIIDGPGTGSGATLPLTFTLSTLGGFSSSFDLLSLFDANTSGYLAASHIRNNQTGLTGYVAADDVTNTAVPEPATMLLLGTGLLAAFRARRG